MIVTFRLSYEKIEILYHDIVEYSYRTRTQTNDYNGYDKDYYDEPCCARRRIEA